MAITVERSSTRTQPIEHTTSGAEDATPTSAAPPSGSPAPANDAPGTTSTPTLESAAVAKKALLFDPSFQQQYASLHAMVGTTGTRGPTEATAGQGTDAGVFSYELGEPTRPDIHHDNGFLQNPNDPSDPVPLPTQAPTLDDYALRTTWEAKAAAIAAYQGLPDGAQDFIAGHAPEELEHFVSGDNLRDIPDGIGAYQHFLYGGGQDREFDYDGYVENDPSGQVLLEGVVGDFQQGAVQMYEQIIADDPSLAGQPLTFSMTTDAVGVGGPNSPYPYPATENWQKAIGAHSIWLSGDVTVTPDPDGGPPQFDTTMTLHGEDRYNFNPGAADITTGTLDAENGRLEEVGLAHQYMHYGTLVRDISWSGTTPTPETTTTTTPR